MPKKLITFDDKTFKSLNGMPNASEFVRQAITEKLARDKNQDSEKVDAKEFLEIMKNFQKTITENNQLLENIPYMIKSHEAKTMKAYMTNNGYFEGLMFQIFKIYQLVNKTADGDSNEEEKEERRILAVRFSQKFIEKYNV